MTEIQCSECGQAFQRVPGVNGAAVCAAGHEVDLAHDIARNLDDGETLTWTRDGNLAYNSAPRTYVVGLPVIVTVSDDGTVTYEVDTSEAGAAIREDDYSSEARRDSEAVDGDHGARMAAQS
jgi:hypothetical protein